MRPGFAALTITPTMEMTVVVPTYRRPGELRRCLQALKAQERVANQVIVTMREDDQETKAFFREYDISPLPLQIVWVTAAGVVAAMNTGLAEVTGDIVALTDDDAVPHSDWLRLIERHFLENMTISGVGGRDWVHHGEEVDRGVARVVGKVQWFGRLIGNHRRGVGEPREVDVLKGVNCAYRVVSLRQVGFDDRLWGAGA